MTDQCSRKASLSEILVFLSVRLDSSHMTNLSLQQLCHHVTTNQHGDKERLLLLLLDQALLCCIIVPMLTEHDTCDTALSG